MKTVNAEFGRLPLVYIIVVNYNGAHYLNRLLATLINGTAYPADKLKIIVVDAVRPTIP